MILLHRTMNLIKKTSKNLICLPQILNIPHTYYVQQATVCTKCQDITKRIFYYVLKDKYFHIQQASPWGQGPIKELKRAAASCKKVERRWQQSLHSQTKQSPFLREKIALWSEKIILRVLKFQGSMTLVINLEQKLHRVVANWFASARTNPL